MDKYDKNRDKISGKPGSGAVGAGVGAVAGGIAAGAAAGTVAGPVGTALGAAAGAVAGGLVGKGVADMIDPKAEDAYWRKNYSSRPYVTTDTPYDEYAPAYRYGVDAATLYPGRSFDDVESDLSAKWNSARGKSRLEWDRAKHATRDAWQRVSDTIERAVPGDSDHDGK